MMLSYSMISDTVTSAWSGTASNSELVALLPTNTPLNP
jgi:hypothetical protein